MEIQLPYLEIQELIRREMGVNLELAAKDEKTISVTKSNWGVILRVYVTLEEIDGSDFIFRCSGMPGINLVLKAVLKVLADKNLPVEMAQDGCLVLHAAKFKNADRILDRICIDAISFEEEGVHVSLGLSQTCPVRHGGAGRDDFGSKKV